MHGVEYTPLRFIAIPQRRTSIWLGFLLGRLLRHRIVSRIVNAGASDPVPLVFKETTAGKPYLVCHLNLNQDHFEPDQRIPLFRHTSDSTSRMTLRRFYSRSEAQTIFLSRPILVST